MITRVRKKPVIMHLSSASDKSHKTAALPACTSVERSSLSEAHSSDDRKDDDSILGTIGYLYDGEQRVAGYINGLCSKRKQQRIEDAWNMHGRKKGTRHAD